MRKLFPVAAVILAGLIVSVSAQRSTDPVYTPKRINKAIELLEQGEPVYYFQIRGGGYERGKQLARTWADAIGYNVEHAPFNAGELRAFIQGLIDGGPTRSGHRTPSVIVTLPVGGIDEMTMRANYWMVEQVLSAGAHGVLLVHARSPEAVRVFVQTARYPHAPEAPGIGEGLRGSGGHSLAASMWGISPEEYRRKADPWPLNSEGEILLGFKPEDRDALAVIDQTIAVPGIGMVEWGPSDMTMSLGLSRPKEGGYPQAVVEARGRILDASKRHTGGFAAVGTNAGNVVERIEKEGIQFHFSNEEGARAGRQHTGRTMLY